MCDFSEFGGPSTEWLAVEATLPPMPTDLSVIDRKTTMNSMREEMSAETMRSMSEHVILHDWSIPTRDGSTIAGRTYRQKTTSEGILPVYVYFHGGGFLTGSISSEDAACSRIALSTGVVVFSVNYRHTPEFIYPTAWNDAEDSFLWLHANIEQIGGDAQKVVVGGVSAGAQLTASLTLAQHLGKIGQGLPPIAGQVLIIPCLVHPDCYEPQLKRMRDPSVSSYKENEKAPLLPRTMIDLFVSLLKIDNPQADDLRLNPGNASLEQVKGLPKTTFGIAGLDPLRDEGLLYAELLAEAGVPTDVHVFRGVPHGFRRFSDKLSASKQWDDVTDGGIKWALLSTH